MKREQKENADMLLCGQKWPHVFLRLLQQWQKPHQYQKTLYSSNSASGAASLSGSIQTGAKKRLFTSRGLSTIFLVFGFTSDGKAVKINKSRVSGLTCRLANTSIVHFLICSTRSFPAEVINPTFPT